MSNQVGVEHQPLDIKGFFYNENSNVIVVDFLFGGGGGSTICFIFAAFLSSVPHHRCCFIPDLSLCHSCNSWKLIPPSDPSHPLAWFLGFDQSHKQTFQVNSVYSSDGWISPPTFSETKPQMVPRDLSICFQGLAAWFRAKFFDTLKMIWIFNTFRVFVNFEDKVSPFVDRNVCSLKSWEDLPPLNLDRVSSGKKRRQARKCKVARWKTSYNYEVMGAPCKFNSCFLVPLIGGIGDVYHHPIDGKCTTYIPLIVLANWAVVCYLQYHLLN